MKSNIGRAFFGHDYSYINLNAFEFEFHCSLHAFLLFQHTHVLSMMSTILLASSHCPSASARKRKAATIDPYTKCMKLAKTHEGVSVSSKILEAHIENRTKPSKKEMVAIKQALDCSVANGLQFANDQCPAGGDLPWLLSCDKRDALEIEYEALDWAHGRQNLVGKPFYYPDDEYFSDEKE